MLRHGRWLGFVLWLGIPISILPSPAWGGSPVDTVLPNGLRVILIPEPKAPVVTVQVWCRVGSRDEISGKTGLSHLMEHMMFKGTTLHGKGEFSRLIATHGGNDNAFTTQDYTAYFENLASDQVALALDLEADRMANLAIDDTEFGLERDVVKEERRMRTDDDPHGTLLEQLFAMAYMAHPYHWPVIGWMDDIDRLTADDLRAYYRRHYVPANATVVVVGDIDAASLLARVRTVFGDIKGGDRPVRDAYVEPVQQGERRVVVKKEAQLPVVFLGFKAPNYRSPDTYALTVLASILTDGKSSRLHRKLVYDRQIAVEVGGDYTALSADPPLFYFYGVTQPTSTAAEVERALLDELNRVKAAPPDARELTKAKNQIEAQFILGQDSDFVRGLQIGTAEVVGAGVSYLDTFVAKIRAVTAEDVARAAATYLIDDGRTVGTLVPLPGPADSGPPPGASP